MIKIKGFLYKLRSNISDQCDHFVFTGHSLPQQQLLQTIDKICMSVQTSVVGRSKGT